MLFHNGHRLSDSLLYLSTAGVLMQQRGFPSSYSYS